MSVNENYWDNQRGNTTVDIRLNGPGNPWQVLDHQATIDALSGGRRSAESWWTKDERGRDYYGGTNFSGDPGRWTGTLSAFRKKVTFLRGLLRDLDDVQSCDCSVALPDLRVRERCGDQQNMTNYEMAHVYLNVTSTSTAPNSPESADDGSDMKIKDTESLSAGLDQRYTKLVHSDISKTHTTVAINHILWKCAQEFWVVTDAVSSGAAPQVGYTTDNGATWTFRDINTFANGNNASQLAIVGDKIIVVGASEVPSYAAISDLKAGTSNPFTDVTGISSNHPTAIARAGGQTVWAAGAGGYIYRSTDGGFTFTTVDAGVATTNALNDIAVASEDLIWFGGASGTLVRYLNGAVNTVTITGTPSDAITTVAVPEYRTNEVYLGTDAGAIYRSTDANESTPTFALLGGYMLNSGSVADIQFAGWHGDVMFVVQTSGSSTSRILRDLSGGAGGDDFEIVGSFTDPANAGLNSIALRHQNDGIVVGEIQSSQGYIGRVLGSTN